ncbi:MAG: hypothetical protein ACOX5G_09910 [Kiritimatiellia bacterium]|jgi:hypothetical protein
MNLKKRIIAAMALLALAGAAGAQVLPVTADLAYWVDASQIGGVSHGDAITVWPDASGNNRPMALQSGTAAPTFATNVINGLPVVRFVHNSRLDSPYHVPNPYTVAVVARMAGTCNQRLVSSANVNWLLGYHGGGWDSFFADGWIRGNQHPLDTGFHIFMGSGDGSNASTYVRDGVLEVSGHAGRSSVGRLTLGGWGGGEYSDGDVAEAIVFTRVLTKNERELLGVYLQKKYAIPGGFHEFTVSNPMTGSERYFSSTNATVGLFPNRPDGVAYQVTLSEDAGHLVAANWIAYAPANPPATLAFPEPAEEGDTTLCLWLRDSNNAVESFPATITYSTEAPTVVAADFETECMGQGGTRMIFVSDIDRGSTPNAGSMYSSAISCAGDLTPDEDYLTLAQNATPYVVTLVVVNEAGVSASTNVNVTVGQGIEAFHLTFETPAADGDLVPISTMPFSPNGGMNAPTYVYRNDGGGRAASVVAPSRGFPTQYARMFGHNGDYSVMQLLPDAATPFIGTDANPGDGRLWVFSLDLATEDAPTRSPIEAVLDFTYPSLFLMTPGDNQPLFQITFAELGYMIVHADGAATIVPDAAAKTPYRIVVEMDVDTGAFRVRAGVSADGEPPYVPGVFRLQQDVSAKGIGGFYFHTRMAATWTWFQTQFCYDNVRLAGDFVANTVDGFRVADAATGDPATATGANLSIAGTVFGPGYTHYILEAGTAPAAPADAADARWVSGEFPRTLALASPVDGTVYDVTLWLLDDAGNIQEFSQPIAYAASAATVSNEAVSFGEDGRPVLSWDTATPTGGRVAFGATADAADGITGYLATTGTSHSVLLDALLPGGTRYYRIEANGRDAATGSFDYRSDVPLLSDLAISTNRLGHVSATWTTDAPAIGWIEVSAGGRTARSAPGALGTAHSADVGGFAANKRAVVTIHADAATATAVTRTRDIGAFTLTFDEDPYITAFYNPNDGFGLVRTAAYDATGGMTKPTFAYRLSPWGRDDTVVSGPNTRFPTPHLRIRAHNQEGGRASLLPPDDKSVAGPIANTDRNYAGEPWVFSFDAAVANNLMGTESRNVYVALYTNYGTNDTLEPILVVRHYNASFLVEYLDGDGVQQDLALVPGLALGDGGMTPRYHFDFTLDMEADTFTADVDGVRVGGVMGFLCGPSDKGIGGIVMSGRSPGVSREDKLLLDDISLIGGYVPAGTALMLR